VLITFARQLQAHALRRHLFFLAATAVTILVIGYHFGTFDQFVHIPFLKKNADPTLFPGDGFIELRRESYSFFWLAFIPVAQLDRVSYLPLQWTLFAVHCAATYLTIWGLWTLSLELFAHPLAALFSTVAFVLPHIGFAGFPVFEFSLLNRTFVLPFALGAVQLYLRGRHRWAFLALGLLYNLHVITVNFVVAMFLLDSVLRWRAGGGRRLLAGLPLFGLGAAPVLIWRLTSPALQAEVNPEWFDVVSRGSLYNLFFLIAPYLHILFVTFSGLSTLALYFLGRRSAPARSPEHERTVRHFIGAVILILTVQAVTALVYPVTLINQLQIIRAGMWATLFGYLYFGHWLARRWETQALPRPDFAVLFTAYVGSPLPFIPLLVLGLQTVIRSVTWRNAAAGAVALGLFAFAMRVILQIGLWGPGLHPFGPNTAWEQIQVCARDNTPQDAVFVTPPEKWWLYGSDWRTFSERTTVVTHSELLMIALAPGYYDVWKERFTQLAPGALEQFAGNFFDNQRFTREAYYRLTPEAVSAFARRYGADYIVMEKPHSLPLPPADWACNAANPEYTVYVVR